MRSDGLTAILAIVFVFVVTTLVARDSCNELRCKRMCDPYLTRGCGESFVVCASADGGIQLIEVGK